MSKKEPTEQPAQTYYYYCCKGKYEDDESGGKRCICHGHIFTFETKLSHCPACGKPLEMIVSNQKKPEAITCALEKCLNCKNRQRSAAVNDEHCLGGDRWKDGKIEKVLGSELCNGCLCKECCQEIIEDANALKKYGMSAVVKAQAQLRKGARQVLLAGSINEKEEKLFIEIRTQNPVLNDIQYETYERWAMDAYNTVKKEMAEEKRNRESGT